MNISLKPAIIVFQEHQLRNDAHFQFYTEFIKLVELVGAAALKIDALWPAFLLLYAVLDAALKKIPKSPLTQKIKETDAARDSVFTGIVKLNKVVLEHHFIPEHRDAARNIDIILHTYGNIAAKPINEKTSAIYNLVQELKSDKLAPKVALIGLTPWVEELERLNNLCESLIQERDRETASKNHTTMRTARENIDHAYREIIETLNALIRLKQLTGHETFVDTLNTVSKRYAIMIKRQQGGKGTPHGADADADEPYDGEITDSENDTEAAAGDA